VRSGNNRKVAAPSEGRRISLDREVQKLLLVGTLRGWEGQRKVIERVREIRPDLSVEEIDRHMQALAIEGLPDWLKPGFWTVKMDQILIAGVREGAAGEKKSVNKILKLRPELRVEVAWARLRYLRRLRCENGHRGVPFSWTPELNARFSECCRSRGVGVAVSDLQRITGYPRDAVLRHAYKLGVAKPACSLLREWKDAELRFLVESVQHLSVKTIAKELGRTERAIWRKVEELGLSAKCLEGFTTREVLKKLHVWHARLKSWIESGWIKVGRNRRITERSLRSFLREHRDELNWDAFDSETCQWLAELGVKAPAPKADAGGQGG
jgi:hypothetical protein